MKRTAKPITHQLNLLLVNTPATTVSQDKQKELKLALIELLTNAARPDGGTQDKRGDDHEFQTNS